MILNDKQIKKLAEEGMITPFVDKSVSNGISMGLQSYGYDICVGSEFKIFTIGVESEYDVSISEKNIFLCIDLINASFRANFAANFS